MNPIIEREVRVRWRNLKSFGLLLAYAVPLAFAVVSVYASAPIELSSAYIGRDMLRNLAWMQTLAWMLFAPTLTATTIAGERERGLLEGLQLSRLSSAQIVGGKLWSALFFVFLITLTSLPVLAICFFLGGVSPIEFCQVLLLSLVTATTCAAIGITCSAWTRRAGTALRGTFVCIVLWGIGSAIAFFWSSLPLSAGWSILWRAVGVTNPVWAAWFLFDTWPGAASVFGGMSFWLVNICVQLAATAVLLVFAARALKRPFGDQFWIESRSRDSRRDKTQRHDNLKSTPENRVPREARADTFSAWWELPLASRLRFANPVLEREARGKLRMRVVPLWVIVFESLLGLAVLGFYLWVFWSALTQPESRETIWWVLAFIGLIVVMISAAMMGAGSLARERENGTWQSLMLSLLCEREIIAGKVGAALLACLLFSLPLWPLLALCVRGASYTASSNGVSFLQAMLTFGVVAATAWCYCAVGIFFSSLCRRSAVASGWTLATLFFCNLVLPMFVRGYDDEHNVVLLAQPWLALGRVVSIAESGHVPNAENLAWSLASIGAIALFGCVLLFLARNALQHRARERDEK